MWHAACNFRQKEEMTIPYMLTFCLPFCTGFRRPPQRNKHITTWLAYFTLYTRFQNLAPCEWGQCKFEANYPLRPPIMSCTHRAPPEQECVDKRPQNGPWQTANTDLFSSSRLTLEKIKHAVVFWTGHLFCPHIQIGKYTFFRIIRRIVSFFHRPGFRRLNKLFSHWLNAKRLPVS